MRSRRTPRLMPEIGARLARQLAASPSNTFTWILAVAREPIWSSASHREPDTLFIGMDQEPICIAYAAQKICEQGLSNALVLPRGAASLPQLFAAGELDAITINFPTPQPKAKYAKKRLVHVDHLMLYRPLFSAGATVTLRTDSKPLRDYALGQFAAAGYDTLWVSDDVRRDHPEHPETEYERRTREMGAAVYWHLRHTWSAAQR